MMWISWGKVLPFRGQVDCFKSLSTYSQKYPQGFPGVIHRELILVAQIPKTYYYYC